MKILYELEITEETGFSKDDLPDRFEILHGKGKTPLVFKPAVISVHDIYNRLDITEAILKKVRGGGSDLLIQAQVKADIDFYFERYNQ
ncbi:hypothetical protein LCGC14_2668230 [marine sediment metagenome]|uniref:Uncharacterized protein n=1 Tax=marine sediment metagenome TaxID=412755 RepID=A0A0F8ZPV4_9ZZZZ